MRTQGTPPKMNSSAGQGRARESDDYFTVSVRASVWLTGDGQIVRAGGSTAIAPCATAATAATASNQRYREAHQTTNQGPKRACGLLVEF